MSETPIINHAEAQELARIKRDESNLARCYIDALSALRGVTDYIATLKPWVETGYSIGSGLRPIDDMLPIWRRALPSEIESREQV